MAKRVALITGGMGGLGETISTKMADAGYTVVVTYSPSNTTAQKWTADMKARGYSFHAYPADVVITIPALPASTKSVARSDRSTFWSTTPASPAI